MPLMDFFGSSFLQIFRSRQVNELGNKPPRDYLELAEAHAKEVQKLISLDCSPSPKIHQLQCEYLGDKLTEVFKYLRDHLLNVGSCSSRDAHSKQCEHIFKGLCIVSKEVKTFVIDCCKDQWIQAAIMMGDQVKYVSLLSSELDFYEIVFVNSCWIGGMELTSHRLEEFDRRRVYDIGIIRQKASLDREKLLSVLATLDPRQYSGDQYTLGSNLLKRLQCGYSGGDAAEPRIINEIHAWEINYKGLKRLGRLGNGGSASVYRTTWIGESLAEKTFANDEYFFKLFMNEVSILIGLSHPNILSLYCYASNSHSCSLVVKLMDDDLYNFIQEKMREGETLTPPFDILEAIGIMLQIAEGMHYLHNNKIAHRDLKSDNILVKLVKAEGKFDVDYVDVRVADFGLSKIKEKSRTLSNQTLDIGTTRWMAPELYTASQNDHMNTSTSDVKLRYPFKVDVYSFGMICYEVLTGRRPFHNIPVSEVRERVLQGLRPQLPEDCPSILSTMIKRCWEPNPSARPSFSEICEDLRYQKALLILGQQGVGFCTGDLEPAALISEGASGKLYRGNLQGRVVAITKLVVAKQKETEGSLLAHQKSINLEMPLCTSARILRFLQGSEPGTSQFASIPRNLKHDNVVELICYLTNGSEWLQVNEFPPKGSLHDLLYGRQGVEDTQIRPVLQWRERVKIAEGAAKGLKYLHEIVQPPVCHGNITSSSIWVFDDYTAKIRYPDHIPYRAALAEIPIKEAHAMLRAPEYERRGEMTQKGDVFSFGLLLLELLCGSRKAFDSTLPRGQQSFPLWLTTPWRYDEEIWQVMDPRLGSEYDPRQAANMAILAGTCLQYNADYRPRMSAIVEALQLLLTQPSMVLLAEDLIQPDLRFNRNHNSQWLGALLLEAQANILGLAQQLENE